MHKLIVYACVQQEFGVSVCIKFYMCKTVCFISVVFTLPMVLSMLMDSVMFLGRYANTLHTPGEAAPHSPDPQGGATDVVLHVAYTRTMVSVSGCQVYILYIMRKDKQLDKPQSAIIHPCGSRHTFFNGSLEIKD